MDAPERRVLAGLGLDRVAIAEQLALVVRRLRAAELRELEAALAGLPAPVRAHIAAHFDRVLDVRDQLERYLGDVLKVLHFVRHHREALDAGTARAVLALVAALGDPGDRQLLTRALQTLGPRLVRGLCRLCGPLPPRAQQGLLVLFADDLPGLLAWVQWLEVELPGQHGNDARDDVLAFVVQIAGGDPLHGQQPPPQQQGLGTWFRLLRPLPSASRLAVIQRIRATPALGDLATLRLVARFHDVTGRPVGRIVELCPRALAELPVLLTAFPRMATALTALDKFTTDAAVDALLGLLALVGPNELAGLVDTLSTAGSPRQVALLASALVSFAERHRVLQLLESWSLPTQQRFLGFLETGAGVEAGTGGDSERNHGVAINKDTDGNDDLESALAVLGLLVSTPFRSYEVVLQRLAQLPATAARAMVRAMRSYTPGDLRRLGEGLEAAAPESVAAFVRIFDALAPSTSSSSATGDTDSAPPQPQRELWLAWTRDGPGGNTAAIVDAELLALRHPDAASSSPDLTKVLEMLVGLSPKDQSRLCTKILIQPSPSTSAASSPSLNARVLAYLCECSLSRHQAVKLLAGTPPGAYDALLGLLRTQRMPEQVALTRLLRGLPPAHGARVLGRLGALDTDALDAFFQLLVLIPRVEYRMLARLLVAPHVEAEALADFVHVAANMMNQASSRELVIFAAELPSHHRRLFLAMVADHPEKGVLLRIVACSSRLAPELLHALVALLPRMPWAARSALVEQIRALDEPEDVANYVRVLSELPDDALLPRLIQLVGLLKLLIRIALVGRLAGGLTVAERVRALDGLDRMRKDQSPTYCQTLTDPSVPAALGVAFLRVFGHLDAAYHAGMLALLRRPDDDCWVFIEVLADAVRERPADDDDDDDDPDHGRGPAGARAVVNGLAASLTRLSHPTDFALLRGAMEDAARDGIGLDALVLVLVHFRDRPGLVAFLQYVRALARRHPTTLFLGLLAKCPATAFLFDMCHLLDLDDAVFALRRLDRLWARDPEGTRGRLERMAARGALGAKDEFCNLVLGFREREPNDRSNDRDAGADRTVLRPRDRPHEKVKTAPAPEDRRRPSWELELADAMDPDEAGECVPSEVALAQQPRRTVPVQRHLQRLDRDTSPRRPRDWREWTNADWAEMLRPPPMPAAPEVAVAAESIASAANHVPARDAAGAPETTEQSHSMTEPIADDSSDVEPVDVIRAATTIDAGGTTAEDGEVESATTLPPIRSRPPSGASDRRRPSSREDPDESSLRRSVSAPVLSSSTPAPVPRGKRYRGLRAGLESASGELSLPDVPGLPRNRGASIFQHECAAAIAASPSRVRFSRTDVGRAKVLAARVQHALGRRRGPTDDGDDGPPRSVLARDDRQTIARALASMASAAALRDQCRVVTRR